ncbi:MAG TPA: hypothetical protein VD867_14560 [Burkholderiales bacterium]|nr:hypothetical protein [Burkholderiales bacterium]
MRALLVFLFATLALGACKDQAATQAEIKTGNTEGQQMRKKYEAAGKEAEERRKDSYP